MVSERLLLSVLAAELIAVVALVAALVAHAAWLAWREPRRSARLGEPRRMLLACLAAADEPGEALAAIARLSPEEQADLLSELAASLVADERARIRSLAASLGLIARAEHACRSGDWARRLRGVRFLTSVGAGETVVPALLHDASPLVRVHAADWAAEHLSAALVEALLIGMVDETNEARFAFRYALGQARGDLLDPVAAFVDRARGRDAESALGLASAIADPRFLPVALRGARDDAPGVRARAATLLGALGGADAGEALVDLLADPRSDVRAAAAGAIGRVGSWTALASLTERLRDSDRTVRRATAAAMSDMGPPGRLFLRRAAAGSDGRAADVARQALELADAA